MRRLTQLPRPDWQAKVESVGFAFHTAEDGSPYWDESACYEFRPAEIEVIEQATLELDRMCLEAVDHVVKNSLWAEFHIPPEFAAWVGWSWETEERTIIGRFDLAYDGKSAPKMLEYNADTPTSLLEAAVVQWFWYQDRFGGKRHYDQFNSIHERLIEGWKMLLAEGDAQRVLTFLTMAEADEDFLTTTYLRDTAIQAGWVTEQWDLKELEFDAQSKSFTNLSGRPVELAFKLYPWEWMLREEFGKYLTYNKTRWLEAPWKMLLSNKALLPLLYRLFPESPYLLPASATPIQGNHVRKPIFGREGAGISLHLKAATAAVSPATFDDGPCIYQQYVALPQFNGCHVVVGSWMVNGYACGIGVREGDGPILDNLARFVPHIVRG